MPEMPAVQSGVNVLQMPLFRPSDVRPIAEVYALSRPARTFTGDFYFTHRHRDRLWLALGDVAGKGLPAAVVMAMIQEELEHRILSCAATQCDPAATMQRLHEFLRPLLPSNRFATSVIANLREDGTLTVANAGHCPPLLIRRDGTVEEIGSTGPILGMLPIARWSSTTLRLARGETLLLYSDGVIESRHDLGVPGLRALVTRHARLDPAALASAIVRETGVTCDDLTLVVVRR